MLHLAIQPSWKLTQLIILLYILTGIVWLYMPFSYPLKGLGFIVHGIHFYTVWHDFLSLRSKEAIISLEYIKSWGWILRHQDGSEYRGILQHGSICTRYFAILYFKQLPSEQSKYIIILPDSLSSTEFRQLRKLLWWGL